MYTGIVWCTSVGDHFFLPTSIMSSARVGHSRPSVVLSLCLQHNSKMNDPKVFKLGRGNDLGIS